MFKIKNGAITGVEAVFIAAPYNMQSPWFTEPVWTKNSVLV